MKLLTINNLNSGYGDVHVLRDISLYVEEGEIVSIVGANGAGKTTLMKTISGQLTPYSGEILLGDEHMEKLPAHQIAAKGIIQVPEGRRLFPQMTVYENLLIGSTMKHVRADRQKNIERIYTLLPRLKERSNQLSKTLSAEQGTTVLLVEQNVKQALKLSKRTYVLENGTIAMEGSSEELISNPHVQKAYLGL